MTDGDKANKRVRGGSDTGADAMSDGCGPPRWSVYALLVCSMALWGGTWPVGRVIAGSTAPWNAAFLRFILATSVLVLICLRSGGPAALRLPRGHLASLFLLGASGIFGYSFLFFSGLKTTPASRAALIVGCIPACIALTGALLARKPPRLLALAGILLSLFGVSVVISNGDPRILLDGEVRRGDMMILGCVACWTCYSLLAKSVMRELSPLLTLTWSCVFGCLLILPFSLAGGLWQDVLSAGWSDWAGLIYLGVLATSLGYYWYYRAIHHVGPMASGIFINLVPLFAVVFSVVFLHERLYASQILGGLMVIGGVATTVRASRPRHVRETLPGTPSAEVPLESAGTQVPLQEGENSRSGD